jgi:LmbE family N-acetylglucosaminyl deacetylase
VLDLTVAVLSPHLDDAVWSLGAAIHTWARSTTVNVITVLAGDPLSTERAGVWDAASGFPSEGEAARDRRAEDRAACAILGARAVWLSFSDQQYGARPPDDVVWEAVLPAVGDADTVLIPGFPLVHPDHRWLCGLALGRRSSGWRVGLFVEQPYGVSRGLPGRDDRWPPPVDGLQPPPRPEAVSADGRARKAKRRACAAYASQAAQLATANATSARGLARRIRSQERRRGGEMVAWLVPPVTGGQA